MMAVSALDPPDAAGGVKFAGCCHGLIEAIGHHLLLAIARGKADNPDIPS
jgi:hypothetical protein